MISQETAALIWECHREIAASNKLLADMKEIEENDHDRHERGFEPRLQDAFGRKQRLQLGVPSGENGHRIFGVCASLAKSVIVAHIANKQAELAAANEKARIELSNPAHKPAKALAAKAKSDAGLFDAGADAGEDAVDEAMEAAEVAGVL